MTTVWQGGKESIVGQKCQNVIMFFSSASWTPLSTSQHKLLNLLLCL